MRASSTLFPFPLIFHWHLHLHLIGRITCLASLGKDAVGHHLTTLYRGGILALVDKLHLNIVRGIIPSLSPLFRKHMT